MLNVLSEENMFLRSPAISSRSSSTQNNSGARFVEDCAEKDESRTGVHNCTMVNEIVEIVAEVNHQRAQVPLCSGLQAHFSHTKHQKSETGNQPSLHAFNLS